MSTTGRLTSAWRGCLWLVRATGLRNQLRQLENSVQGVDRQLQQTAERSQEPPDPDPCARLLPALESLQGSLLERLQGLEQRLAGVEGRLGQLAAEAEVAAKQRRQEAWCRVGDLRGFEFSISSQNGEDGILQEIFRRVGTTNRFFVEFGVETGVQCNCAYLARAQGWGGLFLEPNARDFVRLEENYRPYPAVRCRQVAATSQNIEALLEANQVPVDLDLLSIDIDGNDYWVWAAIQNWHPRVVVMEYNPFHLPPRKWVMKETPDYVWQRTTYFGASLTSLTALGTRKGYTLVGTDSHGVNAFFVRSDCLTPGRFLDPVLQYHFTPFGYPAPAPYDGPHVEI
jgi:hypothetical protein